MRTVASSFNQLTTLSVLMFALSSGCTGGDGVGGDGRSLNLASVERHPTLETLEFRAAGLAWISDTSVALLDRDDQQIVVLGLPGGSERRGAGEGGGPGELTGAFMLLANPDGEVVVGDMSQRRLSHFDAELQHVRTQRLPAMPIGLVDWRGDLVSAIWMRFEMSDDPARGMSPQPILGEIDLGTGDSRDLFALFGPESGLSPAETDNPFSPPFISAVVDAAGYVIAGESMRYQIAVLDRTGLLRATIGRRDLDPNYLTAEERAAERERRAELASRRGPPPAGMERMLDESLEDPQPFFGPDAFAIDESGKLWVITIRERADSTEIDVFDRRHRFLRAVALADRVTALAFRGSKLVALVERTAPAIEGIQGIDLYELEE